jgi:hypothetical protein
MAHGEADHGCAQGEPCRPGHHDQPASGKHHRRLTGAAHPAEVAGPRAPERAEEDAPVPRQRGTEPAAPSEPEPAPVQSCRTDLAGWAGGHRHGPVRPRQRGNRRDRPPRRWC